MVSYDAATEENTSRTVLKTISFCSVLFVMGCRKTYRALLSRSLRWSRSRNACFESYCPPGVVVVVVVVVVVIGVMGYGRAAWFFWVCVFAISAVLLLGDGVLESCCLGLIAVDFELVD